MVQKQDEAMYINFWYPAIPSKDLTQDKPERVKMLGQNFALFRDKDGNAHCVSDVCVHRGGALSDGWMNKDCIVCPYHGWEYEADGSCVKIPANAENIPVPKKARVDSYPTVEKYGYIFERLDDMLMDVPKILRSKLTNAEKERAIYVLLNYQSNSQPYEEMAQLIIARQKTPISDARLNHYEELERELSQRTIDRQALKFKVLDLQIPKKHKQLVWDVYEQLQRMDPAHSDYHKQFDALSTQKAQLIARSELAEATERSANQAWADDVALFMADNQQFANPIMQAALGSAIQELAQQGGRHTNNWYLEQAKARVTELMGIATPAAPAPKTPPKPSDRPKVPAKAPPPVTLGDLPTADREATGSDKYAALDKLSGIELEAALMKLPESEADAYLSGTTH